MTTWVGAGEARCLFGGNVPLIGICTLGTIHSRDQLLRKGGLGGGGSAAARADEEISAAKIAEDASTAQGRQMGEVPSTPSNASATAAAASVGGDGGSGVGGCGRRLRVSYMPVNLAGKDCNLPALDGNHTHFVIVEDGTEGKFGGEVPSHEHTTSPTPRLANLIDFVSVSPGKGPHCPSSQNIFL